MPYTKGEIIKATLNEIGLADYSFDVEPEKIQDILRQEDRLAARWIAKGIEMLYPVPLNPADSTLEEDTLLTMAQADAMILNLALLAAPSFGKIVSQETRILAKGALETIELVAAQPIQKQLPANTPVGAGYKNSIDYPFTGAPLEAEEEIV
jgi:hypothetical protein